MVVLPVDHDVRQAEDRFQCKLWLVKQDLFVLGGQLRSELAGKIRRRAGGAADARDVRFTQLQDQGLLRNGTNITAPATRCAPARASVDRL
jgi:hypothetical protein